MELIHQVNPADSGKRAVDVLTLRTGMSRLMSKKVRLYGQLTCNGLPHRMVDPVQAGDVLLAVYQASPGGSGQLNEVPGVLTRYLDDWVMVVSKPAGMVTHPTYLHEVGSLTSSLADFPLHPVTRLDRDTSGLCLIARNGHAHHVISSQPMKKQYLALAHGRFPAPEGLVEAPIRRSANSIMLREVHADGVPAKTCWHELRYFTRSDVSLVRMELLTGRTHQIRVHCQFCSCPLVGDGLYGLREETASLQALALDRQIGRQALHAASLVFVHPISGKAMRFTAPLPEDFRQLLQALYQMEHPPAGKTWPAP